MEGRFPAVLLPGRLLEEMILELPTGALSDGRGPGTVDCSFSSSAPTGAGVSATGVTGETGGVTGSTEAIEVEGTAASTIG